MKYLFIDTSSATPVISIIEDNKVLFKYHEYIKNDMSSVILPLIESAFKNMNFELKDLDKIFVVTGPGSFTGVRIGVSIAKTIAWGFNIPVVPISSLQALATINTDQKYIVPMLDARRGNVFGAIYDSNLDIVKEESLINKEELLNELTDNYIMVSNDFDDCVKLDINVIKLIEKNSSIKSVNPHELNPRYLKLTQAEESKLNND